MVADDDEAREEDEVELAEAAPVIFLSSRVGFFAVRDEVRGFQPTAAQTWSTLSQTTIIELRRLVSRFVAERNWEEFHTPKNLAMSLAMARPALDRLPLLHLVVGTEVEQG